MIKWNPSMRPVRAVKWDDETSQRFSQIYSYRRVDPGWQETCESVNEDMSVLGGCGEEPEVYEVSRARRCLENCFRSEDIYHHIVARTLLRQELKHRVRGDYSMEKMLDAIIDHPKRTALLTELLSLAKEDNLRAFERYCSGVKREIELCVRVEPRAWTAAPNSLITATRNVPSEVQDFIKLVIHDAVIECSEEGAWDSHEVLLDLILEIDPDDAQALRRRLQA